MWSRWSLALTQQLAGGLVQCVARELAERATGMSDQPDAARQARSVGSGESSVAEAAKTGAFVTAMAAVGVWAFAWLGAMCWWLATGRGPGGRIVAASSVTLRHYDLKGSIPDWLGPEPAPRRKR